MKIDLSHPGTPAVLSFFVPGVGQIFNGKFLWAIFWMVITPGIWIGTQGTLGWVLHFLAAWQAFRQAEEKIAAQSTDLGLRAG